MAELLILFKPRSIAAGLGRATPLGGGRAKRCPTKRGVARPRWFLLC